MDASEAKVEQFTLLAKNAKGLAVVDLIKRATAEPGLFAFGELLDMQNVSELQGTEHAQYYKLLELFAYGTWPDYKANQATLPALDEQQASKLKQLTVVSMASKSKALPYESLMAQLDLPDLRAFEDFLITEVIYAGLLQASLDQTNRRVHVRRTASRDVHPSALPGLVRALDEWLGTTQSVMTEVQQRVVAVNGAAAAAAAAAESRSKAVEDAHKALKASGSGGGGVGIGGGGSGGGGDAPGLDGLAADEVLGEVMMEEDRSGIVARPKRRR